MTWGGRTISDFRFHIEGGGRGFGEVIGTRGRGCRDCSGCKNQCKKNVKGGAFLCENRGSLQNVHELSGIIVTFRVVRRLY